MAGLQLLQPTSQTTIPANRWLTLLLSAILSVFLATNSFAIIGDFDNDCNVDRDDLGILLGDRNKPVANSSCGEACDLDGDGIITVLDGRKLILLCTLARCAVMPDSCTAPENLPPAANSGQDRNITLEPDQENISITLDGSGSSDDDGNVVSYIWDGTPDPEDIINPEVILTPGEYVFTLTVTDDDGAVSAPDTVQIIVEAAVIAEQHPP